MHERDSEDPAEALRERAVTLASRIRIALPYRRAALSDLAAIEGELSRLRTPDIAQDDAVVVELTNLRDTLEILLTSPGAG